MRWTGTAGINGRDSYPQVVCEVFYWEITPQRKHVPIDTELIINNYCVIVLATVIQWPRALMSVRGAFYPCMTPHYTSLFFHLFDCPLFLLMRLQFPFLAQWHMSCVGSAELLCVLRAGEACQKQQHPSAPGFSLTPESAYSPLFAVTSHHRNGGGSSLGSLL